jgi:nitrate/nitrite transport system permease protein
VARGFLLGIAIATPLGFLLGVSRSLTRMFDPIMQVLRPISPLAWLPLGLILFRNRSRRPCSPIAVCSMWPTVINTMMGVRAIPQDYWNVAKVLRLSGRRPSQDHRSRRRCPTCSPATVSVSASHGS